MNADPLDLWPKDIQVAPMTPLWLLQRQGELLSQKTQGRLSAEVISSATGSPVEVPEDWRATTVHKFELVARALNSRHQLAVCVHQQKFAYPVLVLTGPDFVDGDGRLLASQEEFLTALKAVLTSKRTLGLITSLLAQIAEQERAVVPA